MSEIILDVGSGNSIPNTSTAKHIIDVIADIDGHKHKVIIKAQLWDQENPQGSNKWLGWWTFAHLYQYGKDRGYRVTSSVFDEMSLNFLLTFDVPFIKLANRPQIWPLLGDIPRRIPVYISNYPEDCGFRGSGLVTSLACVSKYPATLVEYESIPYLNKFFGISDHTIGLELYNKYRPSILEKHFCLERSPDNPDSGLFALTPEELGGLIS